MQVRMLRSLSGPTYNYRPGLVVEMVNDEALRLAAVGVVTILDQTTASVPEPPLAATVANRPPRRRRKS